jgi:MscS family membrane protein
MEFLDRQFLDNSVQHWAILGGTIALVAVLNPYLSQLLSRIFFQLFRRLAPHKGARFTELLLRPLEALLILIALTTVLQTMKFPQQLDFTLYNIHTSRLLQMILQMVIVITLGWLLLRAVDFVGEVLGDRAALTENTQDDQLVLFLRDVLKVCVYIIFSFILLGGVFDFNITSLLAGAGLAGLAVALAAQDSLANLFGSLTIFSEKPFVMGNLVETNGILGTVEKVGFRSTRIRTLEKTYVTLPNRKIMENPLNNLTERTFRRVQYTVGLLYGTPIPVIRKIVEGIQAYLDGHEKTTQDGIASFFGFGASSLDIQVLYFITELDWNAYLRVREEVSLEIMRIVLENGGDFAFPTTTVHLANASPSGAPQAESNPPSQP